MVPDRSRLRAMHLSPIRTCLVSLLLVAGLLGAPGLAPAAPAAPAASGPVKLVVVVAVDGLSWPRLDGYRGWLSAGLKRLLDEGQVETACRYAHINTETCPGHASLATGAPPRVHGVVANSWFEADPDGSAGLVSIYCTDQLLPPHYREIEKEGRIYVFARASQQALWQATGEMGTQASTYIAAGPGGKTLVFDSDEAIAAYNQRHGLETRPKPPSRVAGPVRLRVPTLGDRLVEASPRSRVVSLSGKDRSAILLAGHNRSHVVYWYDRQSGRFTSSAAFDPSADAGRAGAELVRRFNAERAGWQLLARFRTTWSRLPEPFGGPPLARPAANLARFQMPDLGVGFDHDLTRDPRGYFTAIYQSPFQDQLLTDLALSFLEHPGLALGQRGVPDLFALSYSAHDTVSHSFGNESEEELDTLRRLDGELGRLLARLEEIAAAEPKGQVVLALSSDHGFGPLPEVVRRETLVRTGGRLVASDTNVESPYPSFLEELNRALAEELCLAADARPIFGVDGWTLAYDPRPLRTRKDCDPAARPVAFADIDRVLPAAVRRLFGAEVAAVLLNAERDRWPAHDPAVAFVRNDFDAERSGNAFLVPRENVLMAYDPVRGSGHGSHYDYDTHVPLIFWGGPFRAGERATAATPYDLAPTLADLLGITLPEATGSSRAAGRTVRGR